MSVRAISWAWTVPDLTPALRLTLIALADYADEEWSCFPSQATLAEQVGVSRRTMVRLLKALEDRDLIVRERRSRENGSRSSDRFVVQGANLSGDTRGMDKVTFTTPLSATRVTPVTVSKPSGNRSTCRVPPSGVAGKLASEKQVAYLRDIHQTLGSLDSEQVERIAALSYPDADAEIKRLAFDFEKARETQRRKKRSPVKPKLSVAGQKAKWCHDHGITEEHYDHLKANDPVELERIKRIGKVA